MPLLSHWLQQQRNKNILFIFAHPDDEILSSGALLYWCSSHTYNVHVLILTQGEKGINLIPKTTDSLAKIRRKEFEMVMNTLRIKNATLLPFPDGNLISQVKQTTSKIKSYIIKNNIGIIATHNQDGGDGHPDHITVSRVCKELASIHKIALLFSINPLTYKKNSRLGKNQFQLLLSKISKKRQISLLRLYRSQISNHTLTMVMVKQLFVPFEVYQLVDVKKKLTFEYKEFQCKTYTFSPKKETEILPK